MDYEELYEKYQALLDENNNLKSEIKRLKSQFSIAEHITDGIDEPDNKISMAETSNQYTDIEESPYNINNYSQTKDKINLFMSIFRGRNDIYAKRWQNKKAESGYMPVCLNAWKRGVCGKPKVKCAKCFQKSYATLDEKAIEDHLRGISVVGIYPMYPDETCYFLAIDFDDDGWRKDVAVVRDVCTELEISIAIERSRSGNGAHVWFFFKDRISAALARRFGTALLTHSMSKRHEITFKSYDRFFPNQDTMPKGGLGNLIALPLQGASRKIGNSVFVDEAFIPYADQWEFLCSIKKLSEVNLENLIANLYKENELGILKQCDEEFQKPWVRRKVALIDEDFPKKVKIVKAGMLYIFKTGFSQRALNRLKRLAAFKNPEFYKAQAMRMPTYNKPRVISCSDQVGEYLCLPRGCEADIHNLLAEFGIDIVWMDETNHGRSIDVEFKGILTEEQREAIDELLRHEYGVLSATTAFGKTVVAAKLIAERQVNALILVHRQQLLSQWIRRLGEFLIINEELPVGEKKCGRKKKQSLIGQIGAGKENLNGIIDVAIMQSLNNSGEVKECVKNYGMVIVDECHHVSAFSFEQILKKVNAQYVYGLTATPTRKDGHHPIIFFHCGPVRFKVDAKKQAEKRPFDHYVIPRFTKLRIPVERNDKALSIQEIYKEMVDDEMRNQLIVDDVIKSYENGRNALVLTERTAHIEVLTKQLMKRIPDVITLKGGMGVKETNEILGKISSIPPDGQLTLVATGRYIGEGFDEPRLDTLFLAMPISWRGTLQQYAGRLHRLYKNKDEVQIYDYVDVHVRMLERMYCKRLNGYASIGYKAKEEIFTIASKDIIFNMKSFLPVYINDIVNASREVLIVSPFVTNKRVNTMLHYFSIIISRQVKVTIITRPIRDFKDKDRFSKEQIFDVLKQMGINIVFKSNIHQKFAIIDQRIVWYGSINLLSFGSAEESIMRLTSGSIAYELMKGIEI